MNFGITTASNAHPSSRRFRQMTVAAITTCVGLLVGTSSAGDVQSPMRVAEPTKQATTASVQTDRGVFHYYVTSNVVVRTHDIESVRALISDYSGLSIGDAMGNDQDFFAIHAPDVKTAILVRDRIAQSDAVISVTLDQKQYDPVREERMKKFYAAAAKSRVASEQNQAFGIIPLDDTQTPRGGAVDPFEFLQWHLENTTNPGFDNNITQEIYNTMFFDGTGVNIAISSGTVNQHIDVDHADIIDNYSLALSMTFDPNEFGDDRTLTANAGLISATRGVPNAGGPAIAGQGIAPGSKIATINWGGSTTPLQESDAYAWHPNQIAIKTFDTTFEYSQANGAYNAAGDLSYVTDSLQNSIRFGRNGKGVLNIFGTGQNALAGSVQSNPVSFRSPLPNPYEFTNRINGTFSPFDRMQAALGNVVIDGVNFGYFEGPYFMTGLLGNYPPANDRRALVVNTVSEDGQYDSISGIGTNVFASVYGGTSNLFYAEENNPGGNDAGRGIATIVPGTSGNFGLIPSDSSAGTSFTATQTGPATMAGIVALMLDANPKLSARDIQHILFNSIQESTRAPAIKWPNFTNARTYYIPDSPLVPMSTWELNSGFYNSDTITNQSIRHSDKYGFGMVDAELAVQMATSYSKSPPLILLDTDEVTEDDGRLPRTVPDATFVVGVEADGSTGAPGSAAMIVSPGPLVDICVRQNIKIEAVVMEFTITGDGDNDLYIELTSPSGTRSILKLPSTRNTFLGTADNDIGFDDDRDVNINNNGFALVNHPFLTWKHWGELSGGVWQFNVLDYGPDEPTPLGEDPGTGTMPDPGADMFTALGEIGVPGSAFRSEKEIIGFRMKIYGTDTDVPIFLGCDPLATSCPGDINGDGIINFLDLQIYLNYFITGNAFADMDGDGSITFTDLLLYRGLWIPGFCTTGANSFVGGRPFPGSNNSNGSDNNPIIRPI